MWECERVSACRYGASFKNQWALFRKHCDDNYRCPPTKNSGAVPAVSALPLPPPSPPPGPLSTVYGLGLTGECSSTAYEHA